MKWCTNIACSGNKAKTNTTAVYCPRCSRKLRDDGKAAPK